MNSYVCVCACFGVINWSRIFIAAGIGFCKHPVSLSQRPLNTHTRTLVSFTHTAAKRTALTSTVCVCLRGRLWFGGPSCNHATLRSRAKALREKVSGRGGQWVQSYQRRVYVLCIRQRKAEQVCERETLCDSLWSCPVCYCVFFWWDVQGPVSIRRFNQLRVDLLWDGKLLSFRLQNSWNELVYSTLSRLTRS